MRDGFNLMHSNMKTAKKVLYAALGAIATIFMVSCAKADPEFEHTDSSIHSIEIQPAGGGAGLAGFTDETTGEIFFPIPKTLRDKYDVTSLMVRANLEYDAYITPSLSGLKDLSEPYEITVTGGDGGSRTYTLWAFYVRRTEQ